MSGGVGEVVDIFEMLLREIDLGICYGLMS
jgi:hypothetical protein